MDIMAQHTLAMPMDLRITQATTMVLRMVQAGLRQHHHTVRLSTNSTLAIPSTATTDTMDSKLGLSSNSLLTHMRRHVEKLLSTAHLRDLHLIRPKYDLRGFSDEKVLVCRKRMARYEMFIYQDKASASKAGVQLGISY